jgi:hypothetical protein
MFIFLFCVLFFLYDQDYGEAIQHLEEANWILVDAVNRALPGTTGGGGGGPPTAAIEHPPVEVILDDDDIPPPPPHFNPPAPQFNPAAAAAAFFGPESSNSGIFSSSGGSSSSRGAAGVSLAADFLPLGPAVRSRLLELHIEYRDRMIHLKVRYVLRLWYTGTVNLYLGSNYFKFIIGTVKSFSSAPL